MALNRNSTDVLYGTMVDLKVMSYIHAIKSIVKIRRKATKKKDLKSVFYGFSWNIGPFEPRIFCCC